MNQAIRKLSGLLVLPVLLAALLLMPVRVQAAGYECYADLPVSVVINGDYEEQFTVVLTPGDETTPMPTQSALQIAAARRAFLRTCTLPNRATTTTPCSRRPAAPST